jgi:hypothetical protein
MLKKELLRTRRNKASGALESVHRTNKMSKVEAAAHAKKSEKINGKYTHMPHIQDSPRHDDKNPHLHPDIHDWCHEHDVDGKTSPARKKQPHTGPTPINPNKRPRVRK